MNIFIYFSTYIILGGFLYYFNIIDYNPFIWLIFAFLASMTISIYVIIHILNEKHEENKEKYDYYFYYRNLIIYLILNSPKLILLLLIDTKDLYKGFLFYTTLFIIYLMFINYDLYYIYYTNTALKIINNEFTLSII